MAEISQDAYNNIKIHLGTEKADEVAKQVRTGDLSPEEAEAWGEQLKESFENRSNKTIDPDNWRDFEDGWRPD